MQSTKYISPLFREVPRTKIPISSLEFDKNKCWHCQENERIKGNPDVIIWCQRCWNLQHLKSDGTYIQRTNIPIGKDLVEISRGKVEPKKYEYVEKEIVQE